MKKWDITGALIGCIVLIGFFLWMTMQPPGIIDLSFLINLGALFGICICVVGVGFALFALVLAFIEDVNNLRFLKRYYW